MIEKYKNENSTTKSDHHVTNCTLTELCPYYDVCHNIQLKCSIERMKLHPCIIPYGKKNSKWIMDLNSRVKTLNLLEGNTGVKYHDFRDVFTR